MTQFMVCTLCLKTQNLIKPECRLNPTFPIWHWRTNMEAMSLGFAVENSLSYSVVSKVIELSKKLAQDPAALDKLSMDRTTASYKLWFGLANTMNELTLEAIRSSFFSLNLDESTSNKKKTVLWVLDSYYAPEFDKVSMHHLMAISLLKVDTESIYSSLCKYFGDNNISWDNLMAIMMDSCNLHDSWKTCST